MNHATHTIGNSASVAQRFGTENTRVREEKLLEVLCVNNTAGTLYMQVHEIGNTQFTVSGAGTAGANQNYVELSTKSNGYTQWQSADTNYTISVSGGKFVLFNGATSLYSGGALEANGEIAPPWEQSWSVTGGAAGLPVVTVPIAIAPIDTSVPVFSFPVFAGLGGTLGQCADMKGIYCCWSSTLTTKTIAAASGPIQIVIKG